MDHRCLIENVRAGLLSAQASYRLGKPFLGMVPGIQKAEFWKMNNHRVLGNGTRRVSAQNEAQHPDCSAARLKNKSRQRDFENPGKLFDARFDIYPRFWLAHEINLHFRGSPNPYSARKYQRIVPNRVHKSLKLNIKIEFIARSAIPWLRTHSAVSEPHIRQDIEMADPFGRVAEPRSGNVPHTKTSSMPKMQGTVEATAPARRHEYFFS